MIYLQQNQQYTWNLQMDSLEKQNSFLRQFSHSLQTENRAKIRKIQLLCDQVQRLGKLLELHRQKNEIPTQNPQKCEKCQDKKSQIYSLQRKIFQLQTEIRKMRDIYRSQNGVKQVQNINSKNPKLSKLQSKQSFIEILKDENQFKQCRQDEFDSFDKREDSFYSISSQQFAYRTVDKFSDDYKQLLNKYEHLKNIHEKMSTDYKNIKQKYENAIQFKENQDKASYQGRTGSANSRNSRENFLNTQIQVIKQENIELKNQLEMMKKNRQYNAPSAAYPHSFNKYKYGEIPNSNNIYLSQENTNLRRENVELNQKLNFAEDRVMKLEKWNQQNLMKMQPNTFKINSNAPFYQNTNPNFNAQSNFYNNNNINPGISRVVQYQPQTHFTNFAKSSQASDSDQTSAVKNNQYAFTKQRKRIFDNRVKDIEKTPQKVVTGSFQVNPANRFGYSNAGNKPNFAYGSSIMTPTNTSPTYKSQNISTLASTQSPFTSQKLTPNQVAKMDNGIINNGRFIKPGQNYSYQSQYNNSR